MSTNAKTRYNISKVFGPAVPDKGSKDSDPSADNMQVSLSMEKLPIAQKEARQVQIFL